MVTKHQSVVMLCVNLWHSVFDIQIPTGCIIQLRTSMSCACAIIQRRRVRVRTYVREDVQLLSAGAVQSARVGQPSSCSPQV